MSTIDGGGLVRSRRIRIRCSCRSHFGGSDRGGGGRGGGGIGLLCIRGGRGGPPPVAAAYANASALGRCRRRRSAVHLTLGYRAPATR